MFARSFQEQGNLSAAFAMWTAAFQVEKDAVRKTQVMTDIDTFLGGCSLTTETLAALQIATRRVRLANIVHEHAVATGNIAYVQSQVNAAVILLQSREDELKAIASETLMSGMERFPRVDVSQYDFSGWRSVAPILYFDIQVIIERCRSPTSILLPTAQLSTLASQAATFGYRSKQRVFLMEAVSAATAYYLTHMDTRSK